VRRQKESDDLSGLLATPLSKKEAPDFFDTLETSALRKAGQRSFRPLFSSFGGFHILESDI